MIDSFRFRRELAASILGLLGAASSLGACGSDSAKSGGGAPTTGSGTGSGTTSTSAATTSTSAATSGVTAGTGGAGGASTGSGGSAADGGGEASTGIQPVQSCISLPIDAGADVYFDAGALPGTCPSDPQTVITDFQELGCPFGWEPYKIVSGPTMDAQGDCCYMVLNILCGPGGRPFLVGGEARVAAAEPGAGARGWAAGGAPSLADLTPAQRAALAEAWTTDALHEHASIASFSRFSLDLMAAGAPADIVALAHRAALDEVRHARLCFALASAYAGRDLAPGPLPMDSLHVDGSLAALAASTFAEGCVGETVAAIVAAEQLSRATDPAVRAALAEIAADEARHAELAWRTVSWAVQHGGRDVRAAVDQALAAVLAGEARGTGDDLVGLEAHGRLDAAAKARAVGSAVEEVVLPAARALLRSRPEAPDIAGRCNRAPAS